MRHTNRYFSEKEDIEDIIQDSFLKLWQIKDKLRHQAFKPQNAIVWNHKFCNWPDKYVKKPQ